MRYLIYLFQKVSFCLLFIFIICNYSEASDFFGLGTHVKPYDKFTLRFTSENDVYLKDITDEYYTAGHSIGLTFPEMDFSNEETKEEYKFLSYLAKVGVANYPRVTRFNIDISQEIYTPKNGQAVIPDKNDRPYAGYLYLSLGMSNRNNEIEEHFWVNLGMVGPAAFAKETQNFVHKYLSHDALLKGWDSQLANEFAFNLYYQITRKFHLYNSDAFSLDFLLTSNTAVGNIDIHLGADIRFRIGHNLHVDFGVPKVNMSYKASSVSSDDFSIYLFLGSGGRIVGRNLFIQGNTFSEGTGLKLNPFIYDLEVGVAAVYKGFRLSYVFTYKGKEFRSQQNESSYGSLLLELSF